MKTQFYTALKITFIYIVLSALWILISDSLVEVLFKPEMQLSVSILKGYFFIIVTATFLYVMIKNSIKEILETEAQFHMLFDNILDGIFVFEINKDGIPGKFIDINSGAMNRLNYSKDELLNKTHIDLIKANLYNDAENSFFILAKTGTAVFETVQISKNGKQIPVEISSRILTIDNKMMGVSIVRDLTTRKLEEEIRREAELSVERDKQQFYKETILAVTDGKFELGEEEEASAWITAPSLIFEISDIEMFTKARHAAVDYCKNIGLDKDDVDDFELAIGEAIGNALKHAQSGVMYAGTDGAFVWIAIVDRGTGIDTFSIPKVALLPGFTTKASMGLGYTMILKVCDHVKLSTGITGTTIYMMKRINKIVNAEKQAEIYPGIK